MASKAPSTASAPAILVGRITPRAAGVVFAIAFLVSMATGAGLTTALVRGMVGAFAALCITPLLAWPVVRAVLDAAAREQQPPERQPPSAPQGARR